MSRGFAAVGVGLAALCGVLIPYSLLRPELEKQRAEQLGQFREQHGTNGKVISEAMKSDFKEAREEFDKSGFAWGIRQALFGKPDRTTHQQKPDVRSVKDAEDIQPIDEKKQDG